MLDVVNDGLICLLFRLVLYFPVLMLQVWLFWQQNADLCENVDWKDDHARGGSRVTRLKMSKPRSRWVIICFACCWTLVVCFFESLTRSGQFQVIFYCFRNESLVFLIVPERLVSIQKLSRSKLHKAGPAQDGDWRHTMSANQMHCLDDCSAPDYGAYTGCSKTVLSS